jgi:hypothetical protein
MLIGVDNPCSSRHGLWTSASNLSLSSSAGVEAHACASVAVFGLVFFSFAFGVSDFSDFASVFQRSPDFHFAHWSPFDRAAYSVALLIGIRPLSIASATTGMTLALMSATILTVS